MADDKQESVIDMDTPAQEKENKPAETVKVEEKETTQKAKPAIQINVPLNTLIMVCAIASIAIALLASFFLIVGASMTLVNVFRCINLFALCATIALYLVDYIKNKNFSVNPAFICMVLAIIVAVF